MRARLWLSLSTTVAVLAACSGGTGGTTGGGGTTQTAQSYCDNRESVSASCQSDAGSGFTFNRNDCNDDYTCAVALYVAPDAYFACRTNTDCAVRRGSDSCLAESAQGRTVPQADPCAKKYAACKAAGGKSFDDDTCPVLNALNDSALTKIAACLDKPCDQISECVKATVKAISPGCD
jgi:hypothetical protein